MRADVVTRAPTRSASIHTVERAKRSRWNQSSHFLLNAHAGRRNLMPAGSTRIAVPCKSEAVLRATFASAASIAACD